jgi:hypothetical protein
MAQTVGNKTNMKLQIAKPWINVGFNLVDFRMTQLVELELPSWE